MDQQVAVIRQHPFGLVVPLHADRQLARLMFQPEPDVVADGLHLPLIGARADHEIVGKGGDAGQIEDPDIGGFFGFGCADG